MPKCKNDPSRNYKGDEPSPKGLGYCAHSEEVGTIRLGKDTRAWIVNEIKNGSKRWIVQSKDIFVGIKLIKKLEENKISHLKTNTRKKLSKFFDKNLKNKLNKLGITLFIISQSDWKLGDSYIIDKKVEIKGINISTRLDQKRNPLDWHRDDLREFFSDMELEKGKKFIFVVVDYDSIKKRYLENIYLYNNFDFKKEEKIILKEYFSFKILM